MPVRQFFDYTSYTYTYIIHDSSTRAACIIDPVVEQTDQYIKLLNELDLTLDYAIDTHIHADHITALGTLRDKLDCKTLVGKPDQVSCATGGLHDGEFIKVDNLEIKAIYTPGHTDDSYCFLLEEGGQHMIFTGDTLLIRGCGRTDFQNGDPSQLYDSLHQKILTLPDETIVYPGHDYKGWLSSTVIEERNHNPRLNLSSKEAFVSHMNNLNLPDPKFMDVSVPANLKCGKKVEGQ